MPRINFPATGHTRIGFWGIPQYTQSGMWWFTLAFGFLGLHHLFFRSPHTWLLFLIVNTLTLGYWWIFDLIQLSNAGGVDLDLYGLESPWGPLGIAQGMFTEWAKPIPPASSAPSAPSTLPIRQAGQSDV